MSTKGEQEFRQRRQERWFLILGFLLLGALVALAIWLALTTNYDEHWPPPTID